MAVSKQECGRERKPFCCDPPARTLRVAVVGGDGIGPEVVAATVPLLASAVATAGVQLETTDLDWGAARYLSRGSALPPDGINMLRLHDAVLFGAVGHPDVPDHELIWDLIIRLRQELDLMVNLRPVHTLPGVATAFANSRDVDMLIVRENSEGEYVGIGGRTLVGSAREIAIETAVHTRAGIGRAAHVAFQQARRRRRKVTLVSKSNVLRYGFTLWDEIVGAVATEYDDVEFEATLVDAMAARMITAPQSLDVVLCSNLFGDVLADLAACHMGGLGLAPSANVAPGTATPGLFEPVHGSAPDIAGQGVANPSACILSACLLLEHCGLPQPAHRLRAALEGALESGERTPDLGGRATTEAFAEQVHTAMHVRSAAVTTA